MANLEKAARTNMPRISLAELADGYPSSVAEAIRTAYQDTGFFAVSMADYERSTPQDDRIETLYARFMSAWVDFARLPLSVKMRYYDPDSAGERGYTPNGKEQSGFAGGRKSRTVEWREHFTIGPELETDDPRRGYRPLFYRANIKGDHANDLIAFGVRLMSAIEHANIHLYRGFSLALGLPIHYLEETFAGGNHIIRAHRYPAIAGNVVGEDVIDGVPTLHVVFDKEQALYDGQRVSELEHLVRADRHKDIAGITNLLGASIRGLAIQRRNGGHTPFTAEPETMVINVGDILQWMTGGECVSSSHFVAADRETIGQDRYSVTMFNHPWPLTMTRVPEELRRPGREWEYRERLAGGLALQRFREIGLLTAAQLQGRLTQIAALHQKLGGRDKVEQAKRAWQGKHGFLKVV